MADRLVDSAAPAFRSVHTAGLPGILQDAGISLAVSTYQSNRLILVRQTDPRRPGVLNTRFCAFDRPMGVCARDRRLAVGTRQGICTYLDVPVLPERLPPGEVHDGCYVPRTITFTGDVDIHETAWDDEGELWFVNTRFSCLCTATADASFVPRWRPPFVSSFAPEDRCHLNGLGMRDGAPRYVTALGVSDQPNGWRPGKASGGVLLEIGGDAPLAQGLSMPHSPRWHRGRVWFLESGRGALCRLAEDGVVETVAVLPGFVRGLDFAGSVAFVGLSMIRETASFSGLPLNREAAQRNCGVWAVHLDTGEVLGFLRFEGDIEEMFSVTVLTGRLGPELLPSTSPYLASVYVLPDEALKEVFFTDPQRREEAPEAVCRRARRLLGEGRADAAVQELRACLQQEGDFPDGRLTLGIALAQSGRFREALAELRVASEREPDRADVLVSLGTVHQHLDAPAEAQRAYEEAIRRDPRDAVAHANLGHLLLRLGEYPRGFAEYAWRLSEAPARRPRWRGESVADARLLVHVGGDDLSSALVLMRLIPLAAEGAASLAVSCPEPWLPLLAAVPGMPGLRSARDASPDSDLEVALVDLPRLLELSAGTIPQPSYLDPHALDAVPGCKRPSPTIGVAFEPAHGAQRGTAAAAESERCLLGLLSVLKAEGLSFAALTEASADRLRTAGLAHAPPPPPGDALALAVRIAALDAVIGHDGTAVCLAATMNKATWLVVQDRAALAWWWRWGNCRSDWFPEVSVLDPPDAAELRAGVKRLIGGPYYRE